MSDFVEAAAAVWLACDVLEDADADAGDVGVFMNVIP